MLATKYIVLPPLAGRVAGNQPVYSPLWGGIDYVATFERAIAG